LPLGEKHLKFSQKVLEILKANQIRAEIWENESVSKRIRNFEIQKIPYAYTELFDIILVDIQDIVFDPTRSSAHYIMLCNQRLSIINL